MATKTDPPLGHTIALSRGGKTVTKHFTTEEWDSMPSALRANIQGVLSAIPWGDTHDVVAAFNNWRAKHPEATDDTQALAAFQAEASTAPPETFLTTYAVPKVGAQTYSGQAPTEQALAGGALDTAPSLEGAYRLKNADGTFNRAEGRRLRQALRRIRDGEALPEDQSLTKEIATRYGGDVRKAIRELDAPLAGGAASKAIEAFAPAAYNVARTVNADDQIRKLSQPGVAPAAPAPPQRDAGLANVIGTTQQNANRGFSEMERRRLQEQNQRDFAGAAGRIMQTGDSSNIGAHIAALYGQQQRAGVQQALGSEQVRSQRMGELANLLAQQRAQENNIQQFGERQWQNQNAMFNQAEQNRRSDLQGAEMQRWNAMNQLAQQAGMVGAGMVSGGDYPWNRWHNNQILRDQEKAAQARLDAAGRLAPQVAPQGVYANAPANPNYGPYPGGPYPIPGATPMRPTEIPQMPTYTPGVAPRPARFAY